MGIYQQAGTRDWSKPAVYKITPNGMWWATVRTSDDRYHSDCFHNYQEALELAHEYAAMNRAALALRNLEATK